MTVVVDPAIHRMTVEEYEQFVATSDLDDVELIDGVVYDVSPEFHLHAHTIAVLNRLLLARYPGHQVLTAGSVRIDERSLWNPDVYVLDVEPDFIFPRYSDAGHVLLAVEVSLTTWSHDTGVKFAAYARNGVPEYWVVDPRPGGQLIRHRDPQPDAEPATYESVVTVPLPDGVSSLDRIWDAFEEVDDKGA
jgi:Uma2 family endonuclease